MLISSSINILHATSIIEVSSRLKSKTSIEDIYDTIINQLNRAELNIESIENSSSVKPKSNLSLVSNWINEIQTLFIWAIDWMKLIENFYWKTKDENYNICYVKSKLILNQIIFRVVRIFNIIWSEIPKGETIKLSVIVPNLLMWFDNFLTFQIKIMKNKSEFKFKMVQVIIEIIYPVIVDLFLYISYMIENNGDSKMCVKELKAWRSQLNNLCIMIINSLELCKEKGEVINNKCITIVLDIVYKAVLLTTFTSNNFISENQNWLNFKEFIIQSYQTNVNNSGEWDFEVRNLYNKIKIIVYESLKEKKFELTENTLIFLEDFSYHLFTLFEGILCHSSISYWQDLVVPASIQMILWMVYGDMDIQKDYNQRMINDVCSQIKESINSNEGKLCSLKYRKKLILSLNYLSIISFWKISVDSKFRISDTNTSELYNMDETIKSKINDCIIILTEPFENFGVSFEHSKFIDHLKIISAISNKVDQSFLCQLTDIEDSIHRSNFIFLSKFLIPQCEFYGLHVQMIKLLLLNFWYLILLYHKRRSDPYNLLIHIWKVCQVYYKLSKSSLEMHGNYLMCIKYIEGHIIRHKIDIKSHSVVLDCLIRWRYEQALSEDTFSQLSNLNQGFKNKIDWNKMSTNDWIQIASIQELRSIFQWWLPSQKWINKLELSIDQHNTYNDASFQQGLYEIINTLSICETFIGFQIWK